MIAIEQHEKEAGILNLPNKLTVARILCTLVMIAFILLPGKLFAWLSFVMFSLASLTDLADGYIWGRGAMDIKQMLVSELAGVEYLLSKGAVFRRTLYLAFGEALYPKEIFEASRELLKDLAKIKLVQ